MTWIQDGESPKFDNADYRALMEQVFPSVLTDERREQDLRLIFALDEGGRRASRGDAEGVFRHYARRLSAAAKGISLPVSMLESSVRTEPLIAGKVCRKVYSRRPNLPIVVEDRNRVLAGGLLLEAWVEIGEPRVSVLRADALSAPTLSLILRAYAAFYAVCRIPNRDIGADLGPLLMTSAGRHGMAALPAFAHWPPPRRGPSFCELVRWMMANLPARFRELSRGGGRGFK
ncbi:MAG: hypothetical protein WC068_14640 [Caulobacter sp.]